MFAADWSTANSLRSTLQLQHAHEHPDILDTGTVSAFRNLSIAGLVPQNTADQLIEATRLWRRLQGLLRLTMDGPADPENFPPPLKQLLAEAGQKDSFENLESDIQRIAGIAYGHFQNIIENSGSHNPGRQQNRTEKGLNS